MLSYARGGFVADLRGNPIHFCLRPAIFALAGRLLRVGGSGLGTFVSTMIHTIREIFDIASPGSEVTLRGWLRTKRIGKQWGFLSIYDGSTQAPVQAVIATDMLPAEVVRQLLPGASIEVSGQLVVSPGHKQDKELQASSVRVLGEAPDSYPIQPKHHSMEFLRSIPHLRLRNSTFRAVFVVRHHICQAIHRFFHESGFVYFHSPILTPLDAEGAGELFTVAAQGGDKEAPFFGAPVFLTVSGQIAGEAGAMGLGRIYTFGPTFRAENSHTTRHLAEFWMVEPEMAFFTLADNMDLAEALVKEVIRSVQQHCREELAFLAGRQELAGKDLPGQLEQVASQPFIRIAYTDAIGLLQQAEAAGHSFSFRPAWGSDLQTEHEHYLICHFGGPVIVRDYPRACKAFYMKQNEDGQTVAAMDILLPGVGEVVGGSEREASYEKLLAAMKEKNIPAAAMEVYLDSRRYGSVPHSGFGLGLERLVQFVTGMENIRDVIPFPRTPGCAVG